MSTRALVFAVVMLASLAPRRALAEGELGSAAVRGRLYDTKGHLELTPMLGAQLFSRLTAHDTFTLALGYNPYSSLGFEVRASYALTRHTGLADQVARTLVQRDPSQGDLARVDDMSDLWEMRGNLLVGARWAPIYGKLSLFSESALHFQAYLWGGGGAAILHRESVVYCRQVTSREAGTCSDYLQEDRAAPVVSAALGMRFFANQRGSVLVELRDYTFKDRYRVDIDRTVAEAGGSTGTNAGSPGFTNVITLDLGYAFSF